MIPVILSGGVGSRLWPLSRSSYPKQFLSLTGDKGSMLQQTIERTFTLPEVAEPIVVCNQAHRFLVAEQINQLGKQADIILEPEGRNTAPAIALAALHALRHGDDPLLLVMPADHVIEDGDAFKFAVVAARTLAKNGKLVTFGITPTHAETGYGYIQSGKGIQDLGFEVARFVEKPNAGAAQGYLKEGRYYWNGGLFLFHASTYLQELEQYAPEVLTACRSAIDNAQWDLDFLRVGQEGFTQSPSISIDYAVMENTQFAAMVPLDAGWNDIGSWDALWEVTKKDSQGNAAHGDVLMVETQNSHVVAESNLVALLGVSGIVVVQTADAVLVTTRENSQNVKKLVAELQQDERSHSEHHRKVYRPWGWYDSIDIGERFQVKRIQVKPGAKLSVQRHQHRAEHWVVVRGEAEVRNGDNIFLLQENQSTYIPIGVIHALRNPSDSEPLEIIEVQSGDYLGEDDIERFEDLYGRVKPVSTV